ncbi:hypothetical protein F2Q68_00013017 [Brassica cretica]|uniref:CCHC-type domain-containing protein n=1 Tax=Brassica cretica TaxID=69181 RepID=A0A8S9HJQ0_BRACR|nr:hypothetical protein F2Q68_00013017 [Brassica cretica]
MQTHKPRLDPTSLGEAKVLVEVELDKPFPKQIALDDKQGNIFLVDVEYTWIPSVCGRCGHLGHKEKRCLLPAVQTSVEKSKQDLPNEDLEKEQTRINIASGHMVVQEENSEANLVSAEKAQGHSSEKTTTETKSEEMQTQEGVEPNDPTTPANFSTYSKVTVATSSNFQSTSSPLAGNLHAPTQNSIMEGIPSPIIVSETNLVSRNNSLAFMHSPIHDNLSRNQTDQQTEQDDRDGFLSDATANLSMSRRGRPIKPLQKY